MACWTIKPIESDLDGMRGVLRSAGAEKGGGENIQVMVPVQNMQIVVVNSQFSVDVYS